MATPETDHKSMKPEPNPEAAETAQTTDSPEVVHERLVRHLFADKVVYLYSVKLLRQSRVNPNEQDRHEEFYAAQDIRDVWAGIALELADEAVEVESVTRCVPILSFLPHNVKGHARRGEAEIDQTASSGSPSQTCSLSSETPETDAAEFEVIDDYERGMNVVSSRLARKLERERNELRAKYAMHHAEAEKLTDIIRAATVLIAAKGQHNTMLAYEGLRAALSPENAHVDAQIPAPAKPESITD